MPNTGRLLLPGRVQIHKKQPGIPRYWRQVDDSTLLAGAQTSNQPAKPALTRPALTRRVPSRRLDLWGTILCAKGIPFRTSLSDITASAREDGFALFVPPLLEHAARVELAAAAAEKPASPLPPEPARHNVHWVLTTVFLLIAWHGLRMGWWGTFTGLTAEAWLQAGSADAFRILRRHEWYRLVTALSLHADSEHLFANVLFGAPFLIILCRKAGLGIGLLLTIFSGALGNLFNTLYRPIWHSSIGFSTALFACVGALSGLLAAEGFRKKDPLARRRAVLLLAAGSGVLALLGTDGAQTDYGAHLFGLLAGFLGGGLFGLLPPLSRKLETAAGISTTLLVCLAWYFAFAT